MKKYYKNIEKDIITMMLEKFNVEVTNTSNLKDNIDSLDFVELIVTIEREYEISILDDDANKLDEKKELTIIDIKKELRKYNVYDIREERKNKIQKIDLV